MMTFGISMNTFPLTSEGERPLENHHKWMAKQHILESSTFSIDKREIVSASGDIPRGRNDAELSSDRNFISGPFSDIESQAAKEESSMSKEKVELPFSDLGSYGVSDAVEETPEFLEANLAKLEIELVNITKNKEAYLQAAAEDNGYARCRKFRLKFLRAESFDVKKAAERLARFFKEKLRLFGSELLAKDIKLSDLDKNDISCLESGIGQLLPQKDRAGRCIFAWLKANERFDDVNDKQFAKNKVGGRNVFFVNFSRIELYTISLLTLSPPIQARVLYYILMAASDDEETQKQGMVGTVVTIGNKRSFHLEAARALSALAYALPNRWPSVHFW
jgi:hypothetical protein